LPYWIENKADGDYAQVWVKNEWNDSTIYLYYGNDEASDESNGNDTFPLYFTDWSSNDLSDFTYDATGEFLYIDLGENKEDMRYRLSYTTESINHATYAGSWKINLRKTVTTRDYSADIYTCPRVAKHPTLTTINPILYSDSSSGIIETVPVLSDIPLVCDILVYNSISAFNLSTYYINSSYDKFGFVEYHDSTNFPGEVRYGGFWIPLSGGSGSYQKYEYDATNESLVFDTRRGYGTGDFGWFKNHVHWMFFMEITNETEPSFTLGSEETEGPNTLLQPVGPGQSSQWIASSGSNWECVDNYPVNISDHVYSNEGWDSYELGNFSFSGSNNMIENITVNINGYIPMFYSGVGVLNLTLYNAGERVDTTITGFDNSQETHTITFETSPFTEKKWTQQEINNTEIGIYAKNIHPHNDYYCIVDMWVNVTEFENTAPVLSNETPTNTSNDIDRNTNLSVNVSDNQTMDYNITLYKNNSQLYIVDAIELNGETDTLGNGIYTKDDYIYVVSDNYLSVLKRNGNYLELLDTYNETYYDNIDETYYETEYSTVFVDDNDYIYTGIYGTKIYDLNDYVNFQVFSFNETTNTLTRIWENRGSDHQYGTVYCLNGDDTYIYKGRQTKYLDVYNKYDGTDCDYVRTKTYEDFNFPYDIYTDNTYVFITNYMTDHSIKAYTKGAASLIDTGTDRTENAIDGNDNYLLSERGHLYSFDGSELTALDNLSINAKDVLLDDDNNFFLPDGSNGIYIGKVKNDMLYSATEFKTGEIFYDAAETGNYYAALTEDCKLYLLDFEPGTKEIVNQWNGSKTNGTIEIDPGQLEWGTYYEWDVNVTDGYLWANESYWFITETNAIPIISNPYPEKGVTNISPEQNVSVDISDAEGDSMEIFVYTNISGTFELIGSNTSATNGTYNFSHYFSNAYENQTIYWFVNVTDGISWNNQTFYFTTPSFYVDFSIEVKDYINRTYYINFTGFSDEDIFLNWNFGDNTFDFTNDREIIHRYKTGNTYTIYLNVEQKESGLENGTSRNVTTYQEETEAEQFLNIPTETIFILFVVLVIFVLFKVLMDTINGIGKRRKK